MADYLVAESARNVKYLGQTDQGGRPDGCQVMVSKGHAYVCNGFSAGLTVIDVKNPRDPKPINFLPCHPNSWSIHCQTHGDLMLVVEEFNFYKVYDNEESYYGGSISGVHSSKFGKRGEDYSAGLRVYDISDRANPRAIGFMEVEGLGLHRVWWVGDRYAYASALLDGYTDHVFIVIDIARPDEAASRSDGGGCPACGRRGRDQRISAGAWPCITPSSPTTSPTARWRDGGLTLIDVKDKTKPKLISHRNWYPPFGGGTHSALPLHRPQPRHRRR